MLINLKTNKYKIIKEWKKKEKKMKEKKNTSVPRKVGMHEYASQSKGLHGYNKHNCFCRKNFNHTRGWFSSLLQYLFTVYREQKRCYTLHCKWRNIEESKTGKERKRRRQSWAVERIRVELPCQR